LVYSVAYYLHSKKIGGLTVTPHGCITASPDN
jgi:hypothetical protein